MRKKIDLIEFTLKLYQNDRFGQIFSPAYLTEYICNLAADAKAQTILITEAEKSLSGLNDFVDKHQSSKLAFTTSNALMFILLKLGFEEYENVSILNQSIYQELLIDTRFDFIYSLPDFGGKIEAVNNKFRLGIVAETRGVYEIGKLKENDRYRDIKGFCKSATLDEVRSHEYILTPGRYVGIEDKADDGEPFDEKMTRLTGELAEMFAKRKSLEDEIRKRLGAIGYDF